MRTILLAKKQMFVEALLRSFNPVRPNGLPGRRSLGEGWLEGYEPFISRKDIMVDYVVGVVKEIQDQEIIIDIGTMGIALQVAQSHSFAKNSVSKVYSYMHWNAENGPTFFGFICPLDRSIFKVIIGCSGIGPKIALAILADLGAQNFVSAIATGDEQVLSKVNGIGKKKAEHIIVQLKHKVATLIESGTVDMTEIKDASQFNDVALALQSLNYSRPEIGRAMEYVRKQSKDCNVSFDGLLRQALAYLAKQI
jgi:Holliday junction DNA helicase RuvA